MDFAKFYDVVRKKLNLTTQNVQGTDKILHYGLANGITLPKMAYALATAWWETGQTMQPVVEANWLSENWRKKNLRYWPWHGRGLIQVTWEENYRKLGRLLGVDFTKNPDLMLQWEYALPALFMGMEMGLYTGKSFNDYIDDLDESDDEDLREFVAARRIVNGTNKAKTIGQLALTFEKALKAGGYKWGGSTSEPLVLPPVPKPPKVQSFWAWVRSLFNWS